MSKYSGTPENTHRVKLVGGPAHGQWALADDGEPLVLHLDPNPGAIVYKPSKSSDDKYIFVGETQQ